MDLITEIGKNALPGLNKVDILFKELKAGKNTAERARTLVKLENQLEKVFGSPFTLEMEYIGPYSDNFIIIPTLKKTGKIETKEDFISLGSVQKMNIIIGMEIVQDARPRELTAVMLHEIGHVAGHISASILKLYSILGPINTATRILSRWPIIGLVLLPITIITSRSFNWTSHALEYNADKFAAKYGYGDELASIMHRWIKSESAQGKSHTTFLQKLALVTNFLKNKVFGETHPKNEDRIKRLAEEMKKNYAGKYKSKRLQKILDYYSLH